MNKKDSSPKDTTWKLDKISNKIEKGIIYKKGEIRELESAKRNI